jgi:hypothetical protein
MTRMAFYAFLGALATFAAPGAVAPARADSWTATEGLCRDWRGTWTLESTGPGTWSGRINYRHVGGSCRAATGSPFSANVSVEVTGSTWRAQRTDCTYSGTVRGAQLVGTFRCAKSGGPFDVVIDLPVPLTAPPPPASTAARPPTPAPAPASPQRSGAPMPPGCPIVGSWQSQIGTGVLAARSTWFIGPDGKVIEFGTGTGQGRARLEGRVLTIEFNIKGTSGEFLVSLGVDCTEGSGHQRWLTGPIAGRAYAVKFTKVGATSPGR